jgi:hypothetical protein
VVALSMQQYWLVAGEHACAPEHVLGFDEQHAFGLHACPPHTTPPAPLHAGAASAWHMPGDAAAPERWQWKPGWHPVGEPSLLQQSCWSFWAHVEPGAQA